MGPGSKPGVLHHVAKHRHQGPRAQNRSPGAAPTARRRPPGFHRPVLPGRSGRLSLFKGPKRSSHGTSSPHPWRARMARRMAVQSHRHSRSPAPISSGSRPDYQHRLLRRWNWRRKTSTGFPCGKPSVRSHPVLDRIRVSETGRRYQHSQREREREKERWFLGGRRLSFANRE